MAPTHPECNKQGARVKHTDLSGSVVWGGGEGDNGSGGGDVPNGAEERQ